MTKNNLTSPIWKIFLTNALALALFLIMGFFSLTACSVPADAIQTRHTGTEKADYPKLADPSIKKCIDDSYQAVPVKQDGVVHSYLCINPSSNAKCDSWRYFRGECKLTEPPHEKSPLSVD